MITLYPSSSNWSRTLRAISRLIVFSSTPALEQPASSPPCPASIKITGIAFSSINACICAKSSCTGSPDFAPISVRFGQYTTSLFVAACTSAAGIRRIVNTARQPRQSASAAARILFARFRFFSFS